MGCSYAMHVLAIMAAPAAALDFLVMGDWGGDEHKPYTTAAELETARGMGKMAENTSASFVLAVGDNFYHSGVKSVDDSRFSDTFENVFTADSLANLPFHVIAGNHDHIGSVQAQIDYTSKSKRWDYPDSWYTFIKPIADGATIQFVMIDTVILAGNSDVRDAKTGELNYELDGDKLPGAEDHALAESQMEWLEQTLKSSNATFLVVAGHYPVWSICEHGPTSFMVSRVKPMLERYHVTAYLCGHDHCMETLVDSGVDYHVMGSAHLNDHSTPHKSAVPSDSLKFHTPGKKGGFGSFSVTPKSFVARHHDGDGTLLYSHPSRAPRSNEPPPSPPAPAGRTWKCYDGHSVDSHKLHLEDSDLGDVGSSQLVQCEKRCNLALRNCTGVLWHKTDSHCHLLSGHTPSQGAFEEALFSAEHHVACALLTQ